MRSSHAELEDSLSNLQPVVSVVVIAMLAVLAGGGPGDARWAALKEQFLLDGWTCQRHPP